MRAITETLLRMRRSIDMVWESRIGRTDPKESGVTAIRCAGAGALDGDRPVFSVEHLRFPERFLVWAARSRRSGAHAARPVPPGVLTAAFRLARVEAAYTPFEATMALLDAGLDRPFRLHRVEEITLARDEMRLLQIVGLAQAGAFGPLGAALDFLCPPTAARALRGPLGALADALARGGHHFPHRVWPLPNALPRPAAAE